MIIRFEKLFPAFNLTFPSLERTVRRCLMPQSSEYHKNVTYAKEYSRASPTYFIFSPVTLRLCKGRHLEGGHLRVLGIFLRRDTFEKI